MDVLEYAAEQKLKGLNISVEEAWKEQSKEVKDDGTDTNAA